MMALGTREALLSAAEYLLRSKGYAAFSYADLAETVGIRKASIHHHFPTKEDLGIAVVDGHLEQLAQQLAQIEAGHASILERLGAYWQVFHSGCDKQQLPLCAALAAEQAVLPATLQARARRFFELQLNWLARLLDEAVVQGEIAPAANTKVLAYQILSLLEGASLIAWTIPEAGSADVRWLGSLLAAAGSAV